MAVGEGKRRRITVVVGCGRGREGGFGDERILVMGFLGVGRIRSNWTLFRP